MANSSVSTTAWGVMLAVSGGGCVPLEDLDSFSRGPPGAEKPVNDSGPAPVDAPPAPANTREDEHEDSPNLTFWLMPTGETSKTTPNHHVSDGGGISAEATDARADSPTLGQTLDAGEPCEGVSLAGACWYLGSPGASCRETCSEHGGYLDAATRHVGIRDQGGSPEACAAVLTALGSGRNVRITARVDERGVGCHFFGTEDDPWWLSAPSFDADQRLNRARLVCGCVR